MPTRRTVKVAVVGSGLAGLTAAYRLARTPFLDDVEFEVHLFEKASSLGMDSHSVSLHLPGLKGRKVEHRVDVPMRSFQGGYYPQLIALYKHLGVQFRQSDFSYSFSTLTGLGTPLKRKITTTMIYNGDSGRGGVSVPSSLLTKSRPAKSPLASALNLATQLHAYGLFVLSTLFLLLCYLRLVLLSLPITVPERILLPFKPYSIPLWVPFPARPADKRMTFATWMERTTPRGVVSRWLDLDARWQEFVSDVLVPLFSAVCTADREGIWNHPVEEFLDYIWLTLGTHHYVVLNGVRDVVKRITRPLPPSNIHLSTPIVALVHTLDDTTLQGMIDIHCANNVVYTGFSHVILATQANHAANLLDTYLDTLPTSSSVTSKSQEVLDHHHTLVTAQVQNLRKFMYCKTIVVNHTDSTLLPSSQYDWRDLNLVMAPLAISNHTEPVDPSDLVTKNTHLCLPPTYAMATHILPSLTGVYQTTNPIVAPAAHTVLSVARLERAVVCVEGKDARAAFWRERRVRGWRWGCAGSDGGTLGSLQGAGRLQTRETWERMPGIWMCGSYAHCGIPLLEGCVVSGRNVVEQGVWASEGVDVKKAGTLW